MEDNTVLNLLLDTDSYKHSHYLQYPPSTNKVFSYIESRGGKWDNLVFFGMQRFIKKYLSHPITIEMVDEAKEICELHGEPFNYEGWKYIVDHHKGVLPLAIKSIKEGVIVPTKVAVVTVVNTDEKCFWLTSFMETAILRAIWYPTSVATISYRIRKVILEFLEKTGTPELIDYKLNDFGSRGVSSHESSEIGGLAHLLSFKGTDNLPAIVGARRWYDCKMAGHSIPAAEHCTITSWGKDREREAYLNMIGAFSKKGPDGTRSLFAVVSDSYDIFNAVNNIWGESLRSRVEVAGGTLVVRPDSGDPVEVCLKVIHLLWEKFGGTVNEKGYKVLAPCVRLIQGDGVNEQSIRDILLAFCAAGFSADNIAFGMGGALLQMVNRDDAKWAMKCSAVNNAGVWYDVFKDPITDPGKVSKKGYLETLYINNEYKTVNILETGIFPVEYECMQFVYYNGPCEGKYETLDVMRERLWTA